MIDAKIAELALLLERLNQYIDGTTEELNRAHVERIGVQKALEVLRDLQEHAAASDLAQTD